MAKKRRKTRTHLKGPNNSSNANSPKSFVIRSGIVSRSVGSLVNDVRRVMEPNTASKLKERKSNKLRDFLTMCGPIGVSHLIIMSQKSARNLKGKRITKSQDEAIGNINMRICRAPRGPTVTFRINKFSLVRDIQKSQRRAKSPGTEYKTPPLLVLNNFGSADRQIKLLVSVFQGLFPAIHVHSMHLSEARRIVLLNYNAESQTIDYRHFLISVRPVGISRRVRRVIEGTSISGKGKGGMNSKQLPNMSNVNDISEYLLGIKSKSEDGAYETDASSASEIDSDVDDEGNPRNHISLPDKYLGRSNPKGAQRAIRLRELGPRMELRCVKIEEGIPGAGKDGKGASGGNEVLWHAYVQKSNSDANKQRKDYDEREALRIKRRQEQEANVARKKAEKNQIKKQNEKFNSTKEDQISTKAVDEEEEDEDDDDEFAYEDQNAQDDLFEDDDDAIDDEDSMGEVSENEDDDSDLSPVEIASDDEEDDDDNDDQRLNKRKR